MTGTMIDARRDLRALLDQIDVDEILRRRAVQEAIGDALAATWLRRAQAFEAAMPRAGDYPGGAVDWDTGRFLDPNPAYGDSRQRLAAMAGACRERAALIEARWLDA